VTGELLRVVSCDLAFEVAEPAEFVFQVAAARTAGIVIEEKLEIRADGEAVTAVKELRGPHGARIHVVHAGCGRLTLGYRAEIEARIAGSVETPGGADESDGATPSPEFSQIMYLRPSRYCPTDHLGGFAVTEFGTGDDVSHRVEAIVEWIRRRVEYLPGSGTVHDSAEDTLLKGAGTCRDFAHLGVALCRAVGVPARFCAVYAPGLFPMDFHAVFETLQDGRWCLHDPTDLAPRTPMVRIVTGRDAADTAFASVERGVADLLEIDVTATVGGALPLDDQRPRVVELA